MLLFFGKVLYPLSKAVQELSREGVAPNFYTELLIKINDDVSKFFQKCSAGMFLIF